MKYPPFCLQHLTLLSRGNLPMLIFVFICNIIYRFVWAFVFFYRALLLLLFLVLKSH